MDGELSPLSVLFNLSNQEQELQQEIFACCCAIIVVLVIIVVVVVLELGSLEEEIGILEEDSYGLMVIGFCGGRSGRGHRRLIFLLQ